MEGCMTLLNQKLANFLGDFKTEREAQEDPSPVRAICRIVFVVFLMVGFLLLLVYHFLDSPDVRVEQIHHLQPGGKNYDLIKEYLYNKPSAYNKTTQTNSTLAYWRRPVVCPCSNISISWRDFVSFYVLYENLNAWNLSFYPGSPANSQSPAVMPYIDVPELTESNSGPLRDNLVINTTSLTAQRFCDLSTIWPQWTPDVVKDIGIAKGGICLWLASTLFSGAYQYQDLAKSSQILETPILLNREIFYMRIAEHARDSVLKRRLKIDMVNQVSLTLRNYYNGMADLLIGILDRDETDQEWVSYYSGALELNATLDFNVYFEKKPMVFALNTNDEHQIFLHPEVDWIKYYETCHPEYCEETTKMNLLQQLIRAFGLLGGVTTVVLGFVSLLLWPATGLLLRRCFNGSPATADDPERPQASLLMSTTVGGKLASTRQSQEPEV